jgi:hypothetical protein
MNNNEQTSTPVATQWLNKAEIARHYDCSVRHINTLMKRRVIPFLKIGRFVRFDRAACDHAMKGYETKTILTW